MLGLLTSFYLSTDITNNKLIRFHSTERGILGFLVSFIVLSSKKNGGTAPGNQSAETKDLSCQSIDKRE